MRSKLKRCSDIHLLTEELDFLSWECLCAITRTAVLTSDKVNIHLLQNCLCLHRPYTWSISNQWLVWPRFLSEMIWGQICNRTVILCSKLVILETGTAAMHKFDRPCSNIVPPFVWYVILAKARRYLNRDMHVSKWTRRSNNSIGIEIATDAWCNEDDGSIL